MRIAYLFTTFPVLSETFLQREIRAMRELPVEIEVYSLHGGKRSFEGQRIRGFPKWKLLLLIWALPREFIRRPKSFINLFRILFTRPSPYWLNCGENLLGLAFAVIHAPRFRKRPPDLFHAVWATMPAAAAMMLRELTGIPFSMGAHAYDLYRGNGDWLMQEKTLTARLIHTTTEAARNDLIGRGTRPDKITLIRRGLHLFPKMKPWHPPEGPLRLLSVGRLVEKKGYFEQLAIYQALKDAGIPFKARIAGDGPLRNDILAEIERLDLQQEVLLLGKLGFTEVGEQYEWAHCFLFTGKVAANGDRDGLPNVIPEAMAFGLPVLTSQVAGTTEAIRHGKTGLVLPLEKPIKWVDALLRVRADADFATRLCKRARRWTEENFDARKNAQTLSERLRLAAALRPAHRSPWLGDEGVEAVLEEGEVEEAEGHRA